MDKFTILSKNEIVSKPKVNMISITIGQRFIAFSLCGHWYLVQNY